MEEELILVNVLYNNKQYTVNLTPNQISEISSDPEKYTELCQQLEESSDQSESNKENTSKICHKWTSDAIKLLLDIRLGMEKEFNKPSCKKNKLWEKIATHMGESGNYSITGDECYAKYRNLLQTYRHNKEKRMKTGESKITWEFFDIFDDALGNKASTLPPKEILSSSLSEANDSLDNTQVESDLLSTPSCSKSVKESRASKRLMPRNLELSVPQYLYIKNEREREKWQDQKLLKEKEIAALNNLADAIRSTKKNKRRRSESDSD